MHIGYITHEFPPDTGKGGIGTYTFQIANLMSNLGHQVEVFTASFYRNISEKNNDVLIHRVKIREISDFKIKVLSIFTQQYNAKAFDIIECPEIGGEADFIIKKYPRIPLVVRMHTPSVLVTRLQNSYLPFSQKIRYVLGAFIKGKIDLGYWSKYDKNQYKDPDFLITQKAAIITAPSQAMKNWAIKFWGISPEKIKVIPNPYQPPSNKLNNNINVEYKRIMFIGRLNVLKGVIPLTYAIPAILRKNPEWKFRIIGKTEASHIPGLNMRDWMNQKLKNYLNRIEFIDWVDHQEVQTYLNEADIIIIPSLFESFSYVCAEAMCAGKAIIGSKNGGMNELLADNAGILVNPLKYKEIIKSTQYLINSKKKRIHFGIKAKKRIIEHFNILKIANETEKLYFEFIK